jgi:L-ascorbate metabolism protein UlaG (beta-lactamase superfamily)
MKTHKCTFSSRFLSMVFSFGISFIPVCISNAQNSSNQLQITYIANEGFLLKSEKHKILIDALFDNGYGTFAVPDSSTIHRIMNSEAPFNNIDALFLTHYHKDHCNPVLINRYLTKNKQLPFVTSKPSLVFIDGECFGFVTKQNQLKEMTPALNESVSQNVNGIPVTAYGLKHLTYIVNGIDLEQYMFNISFLIHLDGIRIFHSGDIMPEALHDYLSKHKQWNDKIDIAFLYYKMLATDKETLQFIINTLQPKYIVPMHISIKEATQWAAKAAELHKQFPGIIFLSHPLETQTVDFQ